MGVLRDTCRSTPHLVSVLLLVVSARAGLPGTCLTELTTARSALCCKPQSFIELSFKLRLGCDVPVYLDQGIRLEVRRSQEETFQPIRFYAAGTQNRSDSPVTLTTAVSNQVSAEALNYASIFPLEVVNSSEPVTFREYICGESFQTEGVDIRWMQRYSGDSESDVATWSLEDITISIWDGQCCQVIFKQEDEVLSDEVYAIVKGNVTIPPCSLSGNKELYFNQKSNNRRRPRRSLTLTNLNLTSPEADCESIPLSNSSICDVNSCGVNIDICSIGSIECAGCYGDDLLVPSSGMLGSCIGQCLELPPIENGIIAYDVEFGQEATYLCSPGYFRVGVMVRNCTVIDNEGIWSTQPPNCCSPLDLDKIVNLTVRIDTYEDITALVSIFATLSVGNTQLQTVENLRKLSTIVKGVANFVVISDRPISSVMVGNLLNILNSLLQWDSDGLDTESSSSIVESFEDVGARFAQQGELLNSTLSDLSFLTDVVQVQQFLEDNESLNYSPEKDVSASISLPPSLFGQLPDGTNTTGVLFTLYERPDLFSVFDGPVSESKRSTRVIDSLVIGAVAGVDMDFANIDPPVQITLVLLNPQNVSRGSEECVSWNFITNSWTGDGCTTERDGDTVTCQCSHLTNFAVLVDVCLRAQDCMTDPVTQKVLSVITYAGVTVSCFGLIVTVITLLAFKVFHGSEATIYHVQLCIAIFCMLVVFAVGIEQIEVYAGCVLVSVLIHYFTLVAVMWMGAEALLMFQKLVIVFVQISKCFMVTVSLVCWLLPLIPVLIPLIIDMVDGTSPDSDLIMTRYFNDSIGTTSGFCFHKHPAVFFGAFLGPILIVLVFNLVIFIWVIKVVITNHARRKETFSNERNKYKEVLSRVLSLGGVMFLFGLTWLFAALTINIAGNQVLRIIFQALFVVTASFQGFFIFLFFSVLKKETRDSWKEIFLCRKYSSRKKRSYPYPAVRENSQNTKTRTNGVHLNLNKNFYSSVKPHVSVTKSGSDTLQNSKKDELSKEEICTEIP